MNLRQALLVSLFAVLSLITALFGTGYSYNSLRTPLEHFGTFERVHGDSWVEDGASMAWRDLAPWGNRLSLTFDPWRPEGAGPALMKVFVCERLAGQFAVQGAGPYTVPLDGGCDPRVVRLEVQNPFVPSEEDPRSLGVRLVKSEVHSPLGPPLIALDILLEVAVGLCILMLAVVWLAGPSVGSGVALMLLAGFGILLVRETGLAYTKLYALWSLTVTLVFGLALGARAERLSAARRTGQMLLSDGVARVLEVLAVVVVVGGAAAIRFHGLDFGLPMNFHPDEVPKVNAMMRMVDHGDLNPRYFLHPTLLIYSTYFVNTLLHSLELVDGADFRSTGFIAGRIVSASAGTVAVLCTYLIGRRLYQPFVGVFAAALLAVFPLHVTSSRYLKEDSLLLAIVLLCIVVLLKAVQENRPRLLYLAGFIAGCAASTKYSGLLTAGIVMLAPWLRSRRLDPDIRFLKTSCLALLMVPVGFLVCSPYALLNYQKFISDFDSERRHMIRGHTSSVSAWSQLWMYHYTRSLIPGTSLVTTLIAVLGVGVLAWRRRVEDLFVVGLLLLFYLPAEWVRAKPAPQPERYIFPCLPFVALAAVEGVRALVQIRGAFVAATVYLVVLLWPLQRTVLLAQELSNDTRTRLAAWMVHHLPPGARVMVDWKPYGPRFFEGEFEVIYPDRSNLIAELSVGRLKASGADYLVLSSLFYDRYFSEPNTVPALRQRIRDVFEYVPIVRHLEPSHGTYGFHNPTLTLFSLRPDDFTRLEQELREKQGGIRAVTSNDHVTIKRRKTVFDR